LYMYARGGQSSACIHAGGKAPHTRATPTPLSASRRLPLEPRTSPPAPRAPSFESQRPRARSSGVACAIARRPSGDRPRSSNSPQKRAQAAAGLASCRTPLRYLPRPERQKHKACAHGRGAFRPMNAGVPTSPSFPHPRLRSVMRVVCLCVLAIAASAQRGTARRLYLVSTTRWVSMCMCSVACGSSMSTSEAEDGRCMCASCPRWLKMNVHAHILSCHIGRKADG
jgi:hypothetical protein